MAAVSGTVKRAYGFTTVRNDQVSTTDTSEYVVWGCFVDVTFPSGTYAQADNATFAPATVIAATLRDGKTPTILQAAFADAGNENGAIVGAGACAVSSGTVTTPLLKENLTDEHDDGAMSATWNRAITFYVSYKVLTG